LAICGVLSPLFFAQDISSEKYIKVFLFFSPFDLGIFDFPPFNSRQLAVISISSRDSSHCCCAEEVDIFQTAFGQCFLYLLNESQDVLHLLESKVREQIEYLFFSAKDRNSK